MENMTKIRKFPLVWDVVAMLLIFFGSQLIVGVVLQLCGVVAPATSAIDTVPIDSYLAEQESLARYTALLYPLTMLIPMVLMSAQAKSGVIPAWEKGYLDWLLRCGTQPKCGACRSGVATLGTGGC